MRWEDERYVRLYVRDTVDWLALSFEAQGLLALILRKVDRAGLLPLGKHGKRGAAVAVGHTARWPTIEPALEELIADGCVRIEGATLIVPNFIEAQETPQSDTQRKRESRARARDMAAGRDAASRNVTECLEPVTPSPVESQPVTPSCAVPSVPPEPEAAATRASARVKRGPDAPNPRHRPLQDRLEAVFREVRGSAYGFQGGKDAKAIANVLRWSDGDLDEVERRWRRGLELGGKWPGCATIAHLADKWNELAPADRNGGRRLDDWGRVLSRFKATTSAWEDVWRPVLDPLRPERRDGALVLVAPTAGAADCARGMFGEQLKRCTEAVLGADVDLRIEARAA